MVAPRVGAELVRKIAARRPRRSLALHRYDPRSTLAGAASTVEQPVVPAVDVHNHLGRWLTRNGDWMEPDVPDLLHRMDACGLRAVVNLDGRWGAELEENLNRYDRSHPERFATFFQVDWSACARDDFEDLGRQANEAVERGAQGLKVWKNLGRDVRDRAGRLVLPDDVRLTPLWDAVRAAGVPVLIHVADPVAFFLPVDRHNERYEELRRFPRESWDRPGLPRHEVLLRAFDRLAGAQPGVRFVAAHLASMAEDLNGLAALLERRPNVVVDLAARVAEFGRQPRAAARLVDRFPNRVLFGTDIFPLRPEEVRIYFRSLQTADEAFAYSVATPPPRGRWEIHGLDLSPEVLRRVYSDNALELLPRLQAS